MLLIHVTIGLKVLRKWICKESRKGRFSPGSALVEITVVTEALGLAALGDARCRISDGSWPDEGSCKDSISLIGSYNTSPKN